MLLLDFGIWIAIFLVSLWWYSSKQILPPSPFGGYACALFVMELVTEKCTMAQTSSKTSSYIVFEPMVKGWSIYPTLTCWLFLWRRENHSTLELTHLVLHGLSCLYYKCMGMTVGQCVFFPKFCDLAKLAIIHPKRKIYKNPKLAIYQIWK